MNNRTVAIVAENVFDADDKEILRCAFNIAQPCKTVCAALMRSSDENQKNILICNRMDKCIGSLVDPSVMKED